jgi:hypothetical protein
VSLPLVEVVTIAHRAGGTVNDVVLAAVAGALLTVLDARGESPARLVVSVPVSGRRSTNAARPGNNTGVRPIAIPSIADDARRLTEIISLTGSHRSTARASSAVPLGLAFRALSRLGLFQLFVDHQRFVHTFETNLRGPAEPLTFGGHRIADLVPVAVNPGNVGVTFDVLSYAGTLGITVVADPDNLSELNVLTDSLRAVFLRLAHP